jgi:Protein of unknown function (DUF3050)
MGARDLAARLRQAVQGCTTHLHGPVQAWREIRRESDRGAASLEEVQSAAIAACDARIAELREQGVTPEDPRMRKETDTRDFIVTLFEGAMGGLSTRDLSTDLRESVEPLLSQLREHSLYPRLQTLDDIRTFTEHHVFAVWDFMSLLKYLQGVVTCTKWPWVPEGDPETRRLINEMVRDEESDVDPNGTNASHFELYIEAMNAIGANTKPILRFVDAIRGGHMIAKALDMSGAPAPAREFVMHTMDLLTVGKTHAIGAAFTIGRELSIPMMFGELVQRLEAEQPQLKTLRYYLDRHIEIDGGHHGGLSERMLSNLCGLYEDRWHEAGEAARAALSARIALWDGVVYALTKRRLPLAVVS